MKLNDLVTDYLALRLLRPASERTYRYYAKRLGEHTGIENVEDCDLSIAMNFRDKVMANCSGVTWNSSRRHLIALWSHAKSSGLISTNPWRELHAARVCLKPKTIPDSEFEAACRYLDENPGRFKPFSFWRCVYLTLAYTGMRRAQLVGLIWDDIDFAKQTILLRSETSKTYREYTIPISIHLQTSLYLLNSEAKALWNRAPGLGKSQVFNIDLHRTRGNRTDFSLAEDQVSRFFTKLARLSGASLSCHRMRHRLATRLMECDATHARNVQALLGHSNVATTLNYVSPNVREIKRAIDKLG